MRMIMGLLALGAGAYVLSRRKGQGANAAYAPQEGADTPGAVRDAGPEAMRDPSGRAWTKVDEESDQSFPASDPPANY